MTSARQLYDLQELDLAMDRIQKQINDARRELDAGVNMGQAEEDLEQETHRLSEVQASQRQQKLDSESHRERSTHLEEQLYGGQITNPRELKSLEEESNNVRNILERQDAALLELSTQAEAAGSRLALLEQELSESRASWKSRESELSKLLTALTTEREGAQAERGSKAANMDPKSVQRYETIRRSKKGLGVAKVERGLCQACRMALPTHLQQLIRNGRETVLCSSCGRMLFTG